MRDFRDRLAAHLERLPDLPDQSLIVTRDGQAAAVVSTPERYRQGEHARTQLRDVLRYLEGALTIPGRVDPTVRTALLEALKAAGLPSIADLIAAAERGQLAVPGTPPREEGEG
ncbi:hypothetical protein GCM10012275_64280 [Longimycelium tulufanense]|uniref:Antitoxin n=2 Tax=Longimycelium tulufanense TaxID=907463 RepID=A0A8J3FYU1_9PSEU|nr:hypothetical protein GCM10012275_64280 [Longimycelium tulufanense]